MTPLVYKWVPEVNVEEQVKIEDMTNDITEIDSKKMMDASVIDVDALNVPHPPHDSSHKRKPKKEKGKKTGGLGIQEGQTWWG